MNIHLPLQFNVIPPIHSVECLQRKYFIISFDIHESPLGEVQQEPTFADELRLRECGSWTHLWSNRSECKCPVMDKWMLAKGRSSSCYVEAFNQAKKRSWALLNKIRDRLFCGKWEGRIV